MSWQRAIVLSAIALTWVSQAEAQDFSDLPPTQGDQAAALQGAAPQRAFWQSGKVRPFASSTIDFGIAYLRPSLALGYGKPHHRWFGVDSYSNLSAGGGATYVGLRADLGVFGVRGGARYAYPLDQRFLPAKAAYDSDDVRIEAGPNSRYVAGEVELNASVPMPGGDIFAIATGYALTGVQEGFNVWEESLHVVVEPPFLWRGRMGYRFVLGEFDTMRLGPAAEIIGVPGREAYTGRVGPIFAVSLTHHLDALAVVMLTIVSPDSLGLKGADVAQLGLRYRWASGDRWPEFP